LCFYFPEQTSRAVAHCSAVIRGAGGWPSCWSPIPMLNPIRIRSARSRYALGRRKMCRLSAFGLNNYPVTEYRIRFPAGATPAIAKQAIAIIFRQGEKFHMRSDMAPGAIFPDYELTDHATKRRKLSELQGQHPMVLVLSRGGFCPKDRRQAEGLVQLHRELEVSYCRLVTISTDNISETNEYRTGVGAHWPFLSDAGRMVQKDLDIAEYTDAVHNPMIPHVIVLEPGLIIYKIYNGYWFLGRPTLEDLRQDLRAITKKIRPDWDITTPELKTAWHEGRKDLFYPYGKTYAQTFGEQD
jgi:peroxiredoxin